MSWRTNGLPRSRLLALFPYLTPKGCRCLSWTWRPLGIFRLSLPASGHPGLIMWKTYLAATLWWCFLLVRLKWQILALQSPSWWWQLFHTIPFSHWSETNVLGERRRAHELSRSKDSSLITLLAFGFPLFSFYPCSLSFSLAQAVFQGIESSTRPENYTKWC